VSVEAVELLELVGAEVAAELAGRKSLLGTASRLLGCPAIVKKQSRAFSQN
jgi:hypothetical protein